MFYGGDPSVGACQREWLARNVDPAGAGSGGSSQPASVALGRRSFLAGSLLDHKDRSGDRWSRLPGLQQDAGGHRSGTGMGAGSGRS